MITGFKRNALKVGRGPHDYFIILLQSKACTDFAESVLAGGQKSTPIMQQRYENIHMGNNASHSAQSFVGHHQSHVFFMCATKAQNKGSLLDVQK